MGESGARGGVRRHRRGRRPHHALAAAGETRLRRTPGQLGVSPAVRRRQVDGALRRVRTVEPGRLDRRSGRGGAHQARRAVGQGRRVGTAGRGAAGFRRQVARGDRHGDALPPALRRLVGERAQPPDHEPPERRGSSYEVAVVGPGVRGGGDATAAPDRGRRHGAAVRHAPQHARHRLLPAGGARAVSKALGGRRVRQGVRDRAHLPQRGAVAAAQPRVHDARAVSGLRRLPGHDDVVRGAGGGVGNGRAGRRRSCRTAGARWT